MDLTRTLRLRAISVRARPSAAERASPGLTMPPMAPTPHTSLFFSPKKAPQPICTHLGAPTISACSPFFGSGGGAAAVCGGGGGEELQPATTAATAINVTAN